MKRTPSFYGQRRTASDRLAPGCAGPFSSVWNAGGAASRPPRPGANCEMRLLRQSGFAVTGKADAR
jgi:hypothetical protein